MTDQPKPFDEKIVFENIRPVVARELRAEGLSSEQQNTLMQEVGEALLERVTTALLKQIPLGVLLEFTEKQEDSAEAVPADVEEVLKMISQHVPNAEEIIQNEVKAGLQAYHSYLDAQGK